MLKVTANDMLYGIYWPNNQSDNDDDGDILLDVFVKCEPKTVIFRGEKEFG